MTGNVVFLGFAIGGAEGLSVSTHGADVFCGGCPSWRVNDAEDDPAGFGRDPDACSGHRDDLFLPSCGGLHRIHRALCGPQAKDFLGHRPSRGRDGAPQLGRAETSDS